MKSLMSDDVAELVVEKCVLRILESAFPCTLIE